MASQIRSKQPRPLSIINESFIDDYGNNSSQSEATSHNVKESSISEIPTQHRQIRRISVAPLEHPVVALTSNNLHKEEHSSQEHSRNDDSGDRPDGGIHFQNNDRKQDSLERHSVDTVNNVQNNEPLQSRICSEINTYSKYTEDTGDVLSSALLPDSYSTDVLEIINKYSTFTHRQTNSVVLPRIYKDRLNDKRKSDDKSNKSNNSEKWSNEKIKLGLKKDLMDKENDAEEFSEPDNVCKEVGNAINSFNVERQKLGEKESFSKEQQAWRNRIKKSSSFTFSSAKSRPLRRSMGSYDFKKSSFLARYERRGFKKEESASTENSGNEDVTFYLSSDLHVDQTNEMTPCYEPSQDDCEQEQPRGISTMRNYSWHGLYTPPHDGSTEDNSSNVTNQSRFEKSKRLPSLPNLGKILTNQQSQIAYNQSATPSLDSVQNKSNTHTYPDTQTNTPLVRRISTVDQSDFRSLEALAVRLNLPTRRLSTTVWREQYLGGNSNLRHSSLAQDPRSQCPTDENDNNIKPRTSDSLSEDDKKRIHNNLLWLREQLVDMRLQDQDIARKFLQLRRQMLEMRWTVQSQNHMELLDGAQEDVEEERELSHMVDIPSELLSPHQSLLHVGLTKMNFASRRFSTC